LSRATQILTPVVMEIRYSFVKTWYARGESNIRPFAS
jgi:hypothetical protein